MILPQLMWDANWHRKPNALAVFLEGGRSALGALSSGTVPLHFRFLCL